MTLREDALPLVGVTVIFRRHEPTFNPRTRAPDTRQMLRDDVRTTIVTREEAATFIFERRASERELTVRPLAT